MPQARQSIHSLIIHRYHYPWPYIIASSIRIRSDNITEEAVVVYPSIIYLLILLKCIETVCQYKIRRENEKWASKKKQNTHTHKQMSTHCHQNNNETTASLDSSALLYVIIMMIVALSHKLVCNTLCAVAPHTTSTTVAWQNIVAYFVG